MSWAEEYPKISLSFINSFNLPKTADIIDVGGGDSKLADFLLDAGYVNITVLDISENSIERAKKRLGKKAKKITWIVQNILEFDTDRQFDCWHDRAAFHFLTSPDQILKYAELAKQFVKTNGYMVISTFSENGPEKCSGLTIKQYNQDRLSLAFTDGFKKINCISQNHETPFKTIQSFLYCSFHRV
jgi:2-polyprenyl-3-methyl-5-hydroxy-6-metoxy-1,4-benzoquinol methylase